MLFKRGKPEKQEVRSEPRPVSAEPSYIARDTSLEGNLISDGEIHVDGEVRGSIRAHTCLIDANGEVQGGISAQFVMVRGRVIGPITATQITIQNGAHVEGNVVHDSISIENGAYVMGSITQGGMVNHQPVRDKFFDTQFSALDLTDLGSAATKDEAKVLPLKPAKPN